MKSSEPNAALSQPSNRVTLVTGASRGIGAAVSTLMAKRGSDIVMNYRSKRSRAEEIAAALRALGRRALVSQADLSSETEVAAMIEAVRSDFGRIDILVLNASGGLEKGKPADYAMQLNLTAQVRLVDLALPLMPSGGRIVFVTSHLAHFYAERAVSGPYGPVAASKHAGEQALRARSAEFSARGISLVVVSGDMIEGTITPKLLDRMHRGLTQARREQAGSLPTIDEFAGAIADAATQALPNGATIFVGATE
jgi:3-oxoacyl-[acyl-carrier protein] reductase